MKKIYFNLLAILLWSACYDDSSTLPSGEYPSIVADKRGETEYLMSSYGKGFTYEPKLGRMVGRDTVVLTESEYDDYDYQWDLTLLSNGNDTSKRVISNERILKMTILSLPTSGRFDYYSLTLHVTHKQSNTVKNLIWRLKVLGVYGAGVLIAETSDEKTSDISLIMSRTYNEDLQDYSADVVHHKLFSEINNAPIEGQVSSLSYVTATAYSGITALVKGKSIVRMNPVTMKMTDQDQECFFYAPEVLNPQVIFESWGNSVLINNGLVQYFEAKSTNKYSVDLASKYKLADAYVGRLGNVDGLFFDQNAEKIVKFSVFDKEVMDLGTLPAGVFDPNHLPGMECLYGDLGNNSTARWLMRKEGHYYIYEMDQDKFTGLAIYDLENCTDIEKSKCYAFSETNAEFYYAMGHTLYVIPLSGDKPFCLVSYDKFDAKEEITHLLIHKGIGYTTWGEEPDAASGQEQPFWRESKNNVISVATYDGTEGRVYSLPIQYGGSGGIAPDRYIRCYDKFSRITAIGIRK